MVQPRPGLKPFTIEYRDDEGDLVVKHALLTTKEAAALIEEFAARGVQATANDLSSRSEPGDEASVLCWDDEPGRLLADPAVGSADGCDDGRPPPS